MENRFNLLNPGTDLINILRARLVILSRFFINLRTLSFVLLRDFKLVKQQFFKLIRSVYNYIEYPGLSLFFDPEDQTK